MKRITCEMCGSTEFVKKDGFMECQGCGTKYSIEDAKNLMVEGKVDVSGSVVKVDNKDLTSNLLVNAKNARKLGKWQDAKKLYNKLAESEPNNFECTFFLCFCDVMISLTEEYELNKKENEFKVFDKFLLNVINQFDINDEKNKAIIESIYNAAIEIDKCTYCFLNKDEYDVDELVQKYREECIYALEEILKIYDKQNKTELKEILDKVKELCKISHLGYDDKYEKFKVSPLKYMEILDNNILKNLICDIEKVKNKHLSNSYGKIYLMLIDDKTDLSMTNINIDYVEPSEREEEDDDYFYFGRQKYYYVLFKKSPQDPIINTIVYCIGLEKDLGRESDKVCESFQLLKDRIGIVKDKEKALGLVCNEVCDLCGSLYNTTGVGGIGDDVVIHYDLKINRKKADEIFETFLTTLENIKHSDNNINNIDSLIAQVLAKKDELKKSTRPACYVATCVYGSYDCKEVWTLRRFRDNILANSWYGRLFIYTYYSISPTIVKKFGKTIWFKKIWKNILDRMVSGLNQKGVENTPYIDKKW